MFKKSVWIIALLMIALTTTCFAENVFYSKHYNETIQSNTYNFICSARYTDQKNRLQIETITVIEKPSEDINNKLYHIKAIRYNWHYDISSDFINMDNVIEITTNDIARGPYNVNQSKKNDQYIKMINMAMEMADKNGQ